MDHYATIETHTKTKIALDINVVAKWFCGLSDESQADFFVAVTKEAASSWPQPQDFQWWLVGKHLRTCECSTDDAREMIVTLYDGLTENQRFKAA